MAYAKEALGVGGRPACACHKDDPASTPKALSGAWPGLIPIAAFMRISFRRTQMTPHAPRPHSAAEHPKEVYPWENHAPWQLCARKWKKPSSKKSWSLSARKQPRSNSTPSKWSAKLSRQRRSWKPSGKRRGGESPGGVSPPAEDGEAEPGPAPKTGDLDKEDEEAQAAALAEAKRLEDEQN